MNHNKPNLGWLAPRMSFCSRVPSYFGREEEGVCE
jgi:hypothetical protein